MSNELTLSQIRLLVSKDFDQFLAYLTKKELALHLIKNTRSPFMKRDRYKQIKKLNQKILELTKRWGFKEE